MNDPEQPIEPSTQQPVSPTDLPTGSESQISRYDRKSIGEYQLIRRIGGGGMGVVYEALHSRLKRRVAVKVISESYLMKKGASARFYREMEAAGRLEHPHIVQATDAGVTDGIPFLVMEFIQGSNLARMVRHYGALPPMAALEAIEQAAKALGHIHAHGMVHRDVKPSNLLLSERGQLKVADLGLAHLLRPANEDDDVTTTGDIIGTVDYMAPEQAHNSKLIDHRADIYSLGCCMHFLFCGSPVFRAESHVDRLIAHRMESIPELVAWNGFALPKSVNRLFQEMLAKNPERRPQSMGEVLRRLHACRIDLSNAFARIEKKPTHEVGEKVLPLDAGLETTARSLLADGMPIDDEASLKTTILIKRPTAASLLKSWILIPCIALLFGGAFFSRDHWLRRTPVEVPPAGSGSTITPKTDVAHDGSAPGSIAAPMKKFELKAHPGGAAFNVHFSPDGQHLLTCGSDGAVRVWNLASKERVGQMMHEQNGNKRIEVIDVAQVPETSLVVSVCYNRLATIWDWKKNEKISQFEQHRNQVEGIAWIRESLVLTTGHDDTMFVWNVHTCEVIARLENLHTGGVRAVAVREDGLRAVTADYNGNLFLWNLEPGQERYDDVLRPVDESYSIWCADWIPETDQIAIGGLYNATGEPLLIVFDVKSRKIIHNFSMLVGRVNGVRASRDGRWLFSAADEVHGWSLEPGTTKPSFEFTDHSDNVFGVDESPDGTLLATAGTDGKVCVFHWQQLLEKKSTTGNHGEVIEKRGRGKDAK